MDVAAAPRRAMNRRRRIEPSQETLHRRAEPGTLKRGGEEQWAQNAATQCPKGIKSEATSELSTRGVVDITQDVRLKLQILQPMLDDIADADDAG